MLGPHKYGLYLHILTPVESDSGLGRKLPWEGVAGRVKQETNRLMAAMKSRADTNEEAIRSNEEAIRSIGAELETMRGKLESKLDAQQDQLERMEAMLSALLEK